MAAFIVELHVPGVREVAARELYRRARRASAEVTVEGTAVTCVGCSLAPDDEVCFLRFEATSSEDVRQVSIRAELDSARIWRQLEVAG
ncbi:MAG: hypothetical protein H0V04_05285 [Chloroflexi bacterium]|nr:hypothetical protein [Chloroflexota bacterium]